MMIAMNTRLLILVFCISIILSIPGCAGLKSYYDDNPSNDFRLTGERDFDPLSLESDTVVIVPPATNSQRMRGSMLDDYQLVGESEDDTTAKNYIYRVQVFTSRFLTEAEDARDELQGYFDESVYLDFEPPYYKIRIGDFETAEEGEEFLNKVRELGYTDIWLVKIEKQ